MNKRVILSAMIAGQALAAFSAGNSAAIDLKCELETNPTSVNAAEPRFSWKMQSSEKGARQTAWQIDVADNLESLKKGNLLWSSQKNEGSSSLNIPYKGPKLRSQTSYAWRVKIWDGNDKESDFSEPAHWRMGLINPNDWKASWISANIDSEDNNNTILENVKLIWYPGDNGVTKATSGTKYLRYDFDISADKEIDAAKLWWYADNIAEVFINGNKVKSNHAGTSLIAQSLQPGKNKISVSVTNVGHNPAAFASSLEIKYKDGTIVRHKTGEKDWLMSNNDKNWVGAPTDNKDWVQAEVLGNLGMKPWGEINISKVGGPANLFRKEFKTQSEIKDAYLSITALGSYQARINGKRIGKDILTPEWTDYKKRIIYQTYDVTENIKANDINAIGVTLGDGWYASGLGWRLQRFCFGPPPVRFLAQIQVNYKDGKSEIITSDDQWKTTTSAILRSELYAGETYDARREKDGWDSPAYNDAGWEKVKTPETNKDLIIEGQASPPVRVTQELKPIAITEPSPGVYVYDFGQNMVGWVRLNVSGKAGDQVKLRFAEILEKDGNIYTENLRMAEATDRYTLKGNGQETFEPHFTYHGFRYVEVTGFPGKPDTNALLGRVFHTDVKEIGKFKTNNNLVNKIAQNTLWGIRGNMVSVPTDCPQRDERLGWLGDAQAIWRTMSYNMDVATFSEKWITDVIDAQSKEGGFSNVAPRVIAVEEAAPAWGDAGVIVPYVTWQQTGDKKAIEEAWPAMEKWSKYISEANPDFLWMKRRGNDYGDWVPANSETNKDLIATAYWAYSTRLLSEMAQALGHQDRAEYYNNLLANIKKAFAAKFIAADGKIANGSQSCYILSLCNDLVPENMKDKAVEHLVADIKARGNHLSTGFLGSTHLMPVLTDHGQHELAMTLLLNKTFPSWGYMVEKGATTIWERWNSDTGDPAMNSFNHYTYGAVLEWMYEYLGGLKPIEPGFKSFKLQPYVSDKLTDTEMTYESPYGTIVSNLKQSGSEVTWDITVPANTKAKVLFPTSKPESIKADGKPVTDSGIKLNKSETELESGTYKFTFDIK